VSSLLEVGTGFHPDLTGRENIFLNGAILGMRKNEIERKFDEIVNFAEIGKFVNTPVKRYSSGMFVRLAFAVAAHLEPEILLVDEVLAVGDMAFQKKCLGRMNDLAKGGRTVLFVSHNMSAIQSLCKTAIWLDNGHIIEKGRSDEVIRHYQESQGGRFGEESSISERSLEEFRGSDFHFRRVEILDIEGGRCNKYKYMDKLVLVVEMGGESAGDFSPEFRIHNELGHLVTTGTAGPHHGKYFSAKVRRIRIVVGPLALTSGEYTISFSVMVMPGNRRLDTWHNAIGFTIVKCQPFEMPWEMPTHLEGVCVIDHTFSEAD
jgi:lipopolysaccharide transport system ATP-binding protein